MIWKIKKKKEKEKLQCSSLIIGPFSILECLKSLLLFEKLKYKILIFQNYSLQINGYERIQKWEKVELRDNSKNYSTTMDLEFGLRKILKIQNELFIRSSESESFLSNYENSFRYKFQDPKGFSKLKWILPFDLNLKTIMAFSFFFKFKTMSFWSFR